MTCFFTWSISHIPCCPGPHSSCISFLAVIIQAIITASHWAERVFLEYRVMGLTHRHRHQRCQLRNEWAESVETRGCWVGQWLFCFSDLCSWTHSPLQSRDLSQRLAKPWGDNFQGLSHEIPRQHPSRSRRAELEHSERADGGDCGKNRFRWGQTLHLFLRGCLSEFVLDELLKPHQRDELECWIRRYFPPQISLL